MDFTALEQDILKHIASNSDDFELTEQLNNVIAKDREVSEAGCFVELGFPSSFSKDHLKCSTPNPLTGPNIKSKHLKFGGRSLLFIADGYTSVLEIFTDNDAFPKELTDYTLVDNSPISPV